MESDTFTRVRLRNLKRAKLKQLETSLQVQQKNNADSKTIHQTMKDISKVKSEIQSLK